MTSLILSTILITLSVACGEQAIISREIADEDRDDAVARLRADDCVRLSFYTYARDQSFSFSTTTALQLPGGETCVILSATSTRTTLTTRTSGTSSQATAFVMAEAAIISAPPMTTPFLITSWARLSKP